MNKSKPPLLESTDERESGKQISFTTKIMVPIVSLIRLPLRAAYRNGVKSPRFPSRLRNLFVLITLFAVVSLVIDGFLVSRVPKQHTNVVVPAAASFPTLIPVPDTIYPGQISFLHLAHFAPNTRVFLSRDVAEGIRVDIKSPVVYIDSKGNANVRIYVEDDWNVGIHYIQAEDISDHFTASTVLRVVGTWLVPPPHLEVKSTITQRPVTSIDMGASDEGANTQQSLSLHNSGGSVLSWNASSDQPWLQFTPASGVFSDSECIYLAIDRAHLKVGKYTGTITIASNAGVPLRIAVKMQVQAMHDDSHPGLVLSSPMQTFTAIDGGMTVHEQTFRITNRARQALNWSLKTLVPTTLLDQSMLFLAETDWLNITPLEGRLAPGQSMTVHISIHNQPLLPGVYGSVLQFASGTYIQGVALSLTVLPRCGLNSDQPVLHFYDYTNDEDEEQSLTAHKTASCTESMRWGSYTPYSWLTTDSAHGILTYTETAKIAVHLRPVALATGTYTGFIMLFTQHRSQTIIVTLNLLATNPTPSATETGETPQIVAGTAPKKQTVTNHTPQDTATSTNTPTSFALSTSSLIFTATQGQQSSAAQSVMIENTGGNVFNWSAAPVASTSWLHFENTSGTTGANQTSSLTILVDTSNLPTGTYNASATITAIATDTTPAMSSSQTITIVVTVMAPCTFNISPGTTHFSSILLQPRSTQQIFTVTASGNCAYPLSWNAQVEGNNTSWLMLSSTSGSDNGTGSQFTATIDASGILLGVYQAQIEINETDTNGVAIQNSPQFVTVTLTVVA